MSATPPPGIPQQIQIQIDWSELEKLPTKGANVFFIQQTPHEFVVGIGFASPPVMTGPLTVEQARQLKIVAHPIVRLSLAPGRVVELLQLLNQQLAAYQQAQHQ
jgi:hypothetical protein